MTLICFVIATEESKPVKRVEEEEGGGGGKGGGGKVEKKNRKKAGKTLYDRVCALLLRVAFY